MSHDNRVYLNTTLNNVVVIDSEQNQIAVTHPITQVIEITQTPTPTVTVVEETPNNVSVTEAVGNTVIVSANGPQGIQGIRGADPELTALELFTGSIQTQVNSLRAATSSYVQNNQTASMTVLSSSFATTASYALNISDINTAAFVLTSSFNTYTGSVQTQINNINNVTSSYMLISQTSSMLQPYVLTSQTSSMTVRSSSFAVSSSYYQETDPIFVSKSGSFATTGSNVFRGDQTVTGSIAVSGSVVFPNNYGGIYTTTTTGAQVQSFSVNQGNNLIFRATSSGDHYFYEGENVIARFINGGTIHLGGITATATPLMRISPTQVMINRGTTANYSLHTGGTFGLGTGGSGGGTSAALTYDGVNLFTFRNSGGDNGLSIKTNVGTGTNNIQAIVRPNSATSNPGFALAPASASDTNANHLVIGGLHPEQRPNIGIGTFTPYVSASLTVSGGVILGGTTSLISPWNDWSMQIQAGSAGKAIGLYSDIVGQYGYGTSSPYYLFAYNGSSAWRLTTSTNQGFSIDSIQPSTQQRVYVSASGFVGIGTSTPASNLHVLKGSSGASDLALPDGRTMTLENSTTNYINFKTPDNVYAGLAFSTPSDSSAGYISLRQSTGDMVFSNEKSTGYHTFLTNDTERLRIANTETTVRNNLFVSGAASQFTASGTSQMTGQVNIGNVSSTTTSVLNVGASMHVFGNVYMAGTTNFIQNSVSTRANIYFGSVGNSWLNNGNFGLGTSSPTQRLTVVGSSSFSGDIYTTGSVYVTGSLYMNNKKQFNYGAFSSNATQTVPGADQSASFTYNATDAAGGVTYSDNSRIQFPNDGVYNIQFSAQIYTTTPTTDIHIWLKKNGENVANSATQVYIDKSSQGYVAAWNWVYSFLDSDYAEIAWQSSHASTQLQALTAPHTNIPDIPSVIVTVTQVA